MLPIKPKLVIDCKMVSDFRNAKTGGEFASESRWNGQNEQIRWITRLCVSSHLTGGLRFQNRGRFEKQRKPVERFPTRN